MSIEPLVSIITPTYNCRADLELTLASVRAQSCSEHELIVIDGGSTDGTKRVIEQNEDTVFDWVSEPDSGIYDAMNKGIGLAHGRYLQFLNAGDLYFADDTLRQVCEILRRDSPDALFGRFHVTDLEYNVIFDLEPRRFTLENLRYYGTATVNHQAMFVRHSIVPPYSLRYQLKGELNWYLDMIDRNPNLDCAYTKFPLVKYRVGGAGSLSYKRNMYEWMCVVQRRFGFLQNIKNIGRYRAFLRYNAYIKQFYG